MKPQSGNAHGNMPADEFRRHGHAMVEWIARFMKNPERFPVLAEVAPGDIRNALPEAAPKAALPQVRTRGLSGRADVPCLRVCFSGQAHSSIEKGVILAGLGQEGLRKIASDAEYRMRPGALRVAIGEDRAAGLLPMAVVATVGTTSTTSVTEYRLRPVDLQVVDAKTDKPLRDITVHQIIESEVYGGCFKLFPRMEPTDHNYAVETIKTDENGMAAFSSKSLKFACSEYLDHEYLIINIDLKPGAYERDLASLSISRAGAIVHFGISSLKDYQEQYAATLNDRYRGYVIYGAEYPMGSDWYHGRQRLFDVVTNGEGLLAPFQKFTVRLELIRTP